MFSIPNLLTAGNLLAGCVSILFVLQGRLDLSAYMLLIAMILDFLDGFVARLLNQQGELGKQLDSLADIVSFGVAPGVLTFVLLIISGAVSVNGSLAQIMLGDTMGFNIKLLVDQYFDTLIYGADESNLVQFNAWSLTLPFIALIIPFFSLFRLAKFNLDERQKEYFIGLPTPANTLFFASIALTLWFGYGSAGSSALLTEIFIREAVLSTLVVVFSVLLIAEIPLIALKFKDFLFKNNKDKYILLGLSITLIALFGVFALPFVVLLYLTISIIRLFVTKS
jgi:CDP-diacylglycerol---serine O-phosphatidyltransferase